ncbi:hypothetical protein [Chamaesiphon sp. OTE_75_metabat_556]|uniref:hypothetical protein n=1 Tax=Chamaesiphon sp. OTE_75_metabat_556 TaxID=2964692 RepID=UPI00286A4132|nr:hypothetical protein [Chamaesiphon sp. OTE_75_metabat_556]
MSKNLAGGCQLDLDQTRHSQGKIGNSECGKSGRTTSNLPASMPDRRVGKTSQAIFVIIS